MNYCKFYQIVKNFLGCFFQTTKTAFQVACFPKSMLDTPPHLIEARQATRPAGRFPLNCRKRMTWKVGRLDER
jgi:hypothetical protein